MLRLRRTLRPLPAPRTPPPAPLHPPSHPTPLQQNQTQPALNTSASTGASPTWQQELSRLLSRPIALPPGVDPTSKTSPRYDMDLLVPQMMTVSHHDGPAVHSPTHTQGEGLHEVRAVRPDGPAAHACPALHCPATQVRSRLALHTGKAAQDTSSCPCPCSPCLCRVHCDHHRGSHPQAPGPSPPPPRTKLPSPDPA